MASVRTIGDWRKARRLLAAAPQRFRQAMERAVLQEAHLYRKEIVQGLTRGSPGGQTFAPLAETTLATRRARGMRGTKPLIARGDLRRSVVVVKGPFGGAFVGILRTARGRDGQRLVNVAQVHEFGKVVAFRLTPKSQAFVASMMRKAGVEPREGKSAGGIVVVTIPARPFLRPVWEKLSKDAPARVVRRVARILGGDLGGR